LSGSGIADRRPARPGPESATPSRAAAHRSWPIAETALIVVLGLTCGVSAAVRGYYDIRVWGVAGLVLLALLLALVVARPGRVGTVGLTALGGLATFAAWSLLSTSWAEGADAASVEASRWIVYTALFAVLLILLRSHERLGIVLMAATTVGVLGVAGYLVVTMLSGNGSSLFLRGRLIDPLGYTNAQAGFLMLGCWPLVATAEAARSRLLGGAAVAVAVLLVSLAILPQVRAVPLALGLSALALAAVVPGRRRRLWVLVFIAAGLAVVAGPLLDVYRDNPTGPSDETVSAAIGVTLPVALVCGLVWAAADWFFTAMGQESEGTRRGLAVASTWALALIVAGSVVIGVTALGSDPLGRVKREYDDFVMLRTKSPSEGTRLLSGGGSRHDYWRVSLDQFSAHPIRGVGAGNFTTTWFRERRAIENVRQQHSLELQALADLGVIGVALLAVFLVSVLVGLGRLARAASHSRRSRFLAVAGGGTFLVWLVHTSVDWLHLLPGLTGIALCGAAVLVRRSGEPGPVDGSARPSVPIVILCALAAVGGAIVIAGPTLSEFHRRAGQHELAANPRAALKQADDALRFNDEALPNYFLKATAYARLGRYGPARAQLLEAIRREPSNFLPWALLGDVDVRHGDLRRARSDYRAALRRNPHEVSLQELARSPARALRTSRSG
jgi:hypothetical protein